MVERAARARTSVRVTSLRFSEIDAARPLPLSDPVPLVELVELRARQRAEVAAQAQAERVERARLDWSAHVPTEATAPEPEPSVPPAAPERDPAGVRAEIVSGRWRDAEESARLRAESGALNGLPTAADFATWSDERLAALGADPEDLDDEHWDDEGADSLDVHPVYLAVDELERAQRRLREAEAERVLAAVSAWRVAKASVTGTTDTAADRTFFDSVVMDVAHTLQVAERTATAMINAAMALEASAPECWRLFTLGEVPWRVMQMVLARMDGLDERFWSDFDTKAAGVITTVAVPKLKKRLRAIRERIQAENAVERHRKALTKMNVTIEPLDDGMVEIIAVVPAPEGVSIDQRLDLAATAAAAVEGETRSIGELRAHILLDVIDEGLFRGASAGAEGLAVATRRPVQAKVGVLVPMKTLLGESDAPATLEGYGPIDIETAKRLLGTARSFFRVLTDPVTGIVKDIDRTRYRPTAEMRTFLGIVDGGGRGPNSDRPPSQTQMDHVVPFRQRLARGRTALDNLVLLARRDHRVKTSGLWEIQLSENRDLAWTSFYGKRIITTVEPSEPGPVPEEPLEDCPF
jgi:hypothetical protein